MPLMRGSMNKHPFPGCKLLNIEISPNSCPLDAERLSRFILEPGKHSPLQVVLHTSISFGGFHSVPGLKAYNTVYF